MDVLKSLFYGWHNFCKGLNSEKMPKEKSEKSKFSMMAHLTASGETSATLCLMCFENIDSEKTLYGLPRFETAECKDSHQLHRCVKIKSLCFLFIGCQDESLMKREICLCNTDKSS